MGQPAELLAALVAWHMGPLHTYERLLVYLLAFGPFLLLAVVIVVRRRMDDAAPDGDQAPEVGESPDHSSPASH